MLEDLLETWATHNAINLRLLASLPPDGLGVAAPGSMSVGQQLGHIHTVRVRWAEESEPKLAEGSLKFGRGENPSREALAQAMADSGEIIAKLLSKRSQAGLGVEGFPGSLTSFVGYLIFHESHHRGQIVLTLKQSGNPLSKEQGLELWKGWWGREVGSP